MSDLQTRAQQLIASGYRPVPVKGKQIAYAGDTFERDYAPEHFTDGTRIQIRAGLQKDGTFLCAADLEGPSHGPTYDAEAERAALEAALPAIAKKLIWARSTSGDGWWPIFRTYVKLSSGQLFRDGHKIGDFIAAGGTCRVPDFGNQAPAILTKTEVETLLQFWTVHSSDRSDGERWSDRAKEGKRYTAGWQREQVPDLAEWLRGLKVSDKAAPFRDELLDKLSTATRGERSTFAGRLARFILNHIHQLDTTGDFYKRCRLYKALWMQAKSYGKAGENYNQDKDGDALLTQILYEDEMTFGGRWRAPAWMRAWLGLQIGGKTTPPASVEPTAPPKRPAHRPVGDRDRMLAKIRRYIELRAFETDGKLYYHVDDLAACFGIARRTMQTYLADIAEITRGQDPGPGGRAWLIWGADNSENVTQTAPESPLIWGADESADLSIQTRQSADRALVCIEDHQDTCAPAPAALTADPYPMIDRQARAAAELEERVARETEILKRAWMDRGKDAEGNVTWTPKLAGSKRRTPTRQRTVQAAIRARVSAEDEREQRIERLDRRVWLERLAGRRPTKRAHRLARLLRERRTERAARTLAPAPYRERLKMPEADLPDLPVAGAPLGAQSFGDLPEAPAVAEAPPEWRVVAYRGRYALRGPAGECRWFASEQDAIAAQAGAI